MLFLPGFSGDGDTRILKSMENFTQIGVQDNDLPENWDRFFFAKMIPDICSLQDATHIEVKLTRRMLKTIMLGKYVISINYFKQVIENFPKVQHLLTISDLASKDKMSYEIVKKIMHPGVSDCLKKLPETEAVLVYLKLMKCVNEAYISFGTSPEMRVRCAWWCVFFCRYWRADLLLKKKEDRKNSKPKECSTTLKNFISSNTYSGLELNAHNLVNVLMKCRDEGKPEYFLPGLKSSQQCESYFRRTRSMTSTFSTIVNFTVFDLLHRAKRSQTITELINELGETYIFPSKEITSEHVVPQYLPSNQKISNLVFEAMQEAIDDLELLGKYLFIFLIFVLHTKNLNLISDISCSNSAKLDITYKDAEVEKAGPKVATSSQPSQKIQGKTTENIRASSEMLKDLEDHLKTKTSSPIESQEEEITPNSFVKFKGSKGDDLFVRKSSCLWAWERNKKRVSTDRVYRFISEKKNNPNTDTGFISVGDYVCFLVEDEIIVGYVLGFTYLSGKRTEYTLPYCPINPDIPVGIKRGIAVLCSLFSIGDKILLPKNITEYINIEHYIMHSNVVPVDSELQLSDSSYKDISLFF